MAIQSFQLDPAAGGVSQAEFDAHTHSYRQVSRLGTDVNKNYGSPTYVDVLDDTEVVSTPGNDMEAVGITTQTEQTGVPT